MDSWAKEVKGVSKVPTSDWNKPKEPSIFDGIMGQASKSLSGIKIGLPGTPDWATPTLGDIGQAVSTTGEQAMQGVRDIGNSVSNLATGIMTGEGKDNVRSPFLAGLNKIASAPFVGATKLAPDMLESAAQSVMQPVGKAVVSGIDTGARSLGIDTTSPLYRQTMGDVGNIAGFAGSALGMKYGLGQENPLTALKDGLSLGKKTGSMIQKDFSRGVDGVVGGVTDLKTKIQTPKPVIPEIDAVLKQGAKIGLDERQVRNIVTAPPKVQETFKKMLNVAENTKSGTGIVAKVQPKTLVGKEFVGEASNLNKRNISFIKAKKQLITGLGDQKFDLAPARKNIQNSIDNYGIKIDKNTGKLNFEDSVFAKNIKSQKLIQEMFDDAASKPKANALWIDNKKKAYGAEINRGMKKDLYTEDIKKIANDFYFGLDDSISQIVPAYRKLNSQISEVSSVIKDVNKMLGNKDINNIDLKSLKAGEKLDTLLTNMAGNNRPVIEKLLETSKKYGGKTSIDDIERMVSFSYLIDDLMPSQARSLRGNIQSAGKNLASDAMQFMSGGTLGKLGVVSKYASRLSGDLTEKQIKLVKELLSKKSTPLVKKAKEVSEKRKNK